MKITVIPAIDIIAGKCVRLTQGDYASCKTYFNDPVEIAKRFEDAGMKRLHLVDLDGAKASRMMNFRVLERICKYTSLEVDFGGGIKDEQDIDRVFGAGAAFVCIGSMAQRDRETTREWLEKYGGGRVIVGADVRDNQVCINGWKVVTETSIDELIGWYLPALKYLICTDIALDGMLSGPSLGLYQRLLTHYPEITLIASGGVSSLDDVEALAEIGISSVIVGKAIYENRLKIRECGSL